MGKRYGYLSGVLVLVAGVFLSSYVVAENADLIKEIEAIMAKDEVIQGRFVQEKKLAGFSHAIKSSGSFYLEKSKMLKWETTAPIQSQLTIDIEQNHYLMDGKDMLGEAAGASAFSMVGEIVISAFGGNWQKLANHFVLAGEVAQGTWSVTLHAKSDVMSRAIDEIIISGDHYVKNIWISDKARDETHIQFLELTFPSPNQE